MNPNLAADQAAPDQPAPDQEPLRQAYWVVAVVASVLLLLYGILTTSPLVYVPGAAAPLLALRWPRSSLSLVLLLPAADLGYFVGWPRVPVAALLVAAFCATRRRPWVGRVLVGAAVLLPVYEYFAGSSAPYAEAGFAFPNPAWVLALYVVLGMATLWSARWFRSVVAERSGLAREKQAVTNDAALLGERSRLARDLHDVVAHHVSLIAVRAETAPYTVADLSPAARVVLADIADDSRKALDELRGVLGVLRRADDGSRAPQPSGADVPELVARAAAAGEVLLIDEGQLDLLDATAGYVAYRAVQEALTNARRHAPGAPVVVEVSVLDVGVRIRVTNPADGMSDVVPGRGLTGMQERVEAVDGSFRTERWGGDFVVEVILPG